MRFRIEPMKKIVRTLRTHRALLLNYFLTWQTARAAAHHEFP